ncbi:MAG: nucleotidyl transferase AbiEii/AbiGii toxin family protein [Deltaproteobacteria bacterium]|nr:nucleotidyl transferase AbiEii/AbiGii toxin family protein [Deltaproteobacteria bacterium]
MAEKFKTLAQRASRKDFYDLYSIIHLRKISVKEAIDIIKRRFESTGLNFYHILRSLTYFEDAEKEPAPRLIQEGYSWEEVKAFFVQNIRDFERWIISSSPH